MFELTCIRLILVIEPDPDYVNVSLIILIRCFQLSVIHTMAKPVPQPTTVVAINVTTSAVNPNIIFSSFDCCCFVFLLFFSLFLTRIIRPPSLQNPCRNRDFFKISEKNFSKRISVLFSGIQDAAKCRQAL